MSGRGIIQRRPAPSLPRQHLRIGDIHRIPLGKRHHVIKGRAEVQLVVALFHIAQVRAAQGVGEFEQGAQSGHTTLQPLFGEPTSAGSMAVLLAGQADIGTTARGEPQPCARKAPSIDTLNSGRAWCFPRRWVSGFQWIFSSDPRQRALRATPNRPVAAKD